MKKIILLLICLCMISVICLKVLFDKESEQSASSSAHIPQINDDNRIDDLIENMTLEEKVGQMFIVRHPESQQNKVISSYHIGGYILFARDFENENKQSMAEKIKTYHETAKIPLFIGVDEEGGTVNRISKFSQYRQTPFLSPQSLYKQGGMELIKTDTQEKCQLLKEIGVNVNFAPVCDISTHQDDFMFERSFGKDASSTSEYIKTVVSVMKDNKVASVLKHFPGYGHNIDTHTNIAYDKRSYDEFVSSDFLPFQAGIDTGADIVLVSHNIVECLDQKYPASLSKKVHDILREELHFQGVIITDDLSMDGVSQFSDDKAAVLAIQAGNDLLCCTDYEVQIPAVIDSVKKGQISEEQINESVKRILKLKRSLGLI